MAFSTGTGGADIVVIATMDASGVVKGATQANAAVESVGKKAQISGRTAAIRMEQMGRNMTSVGRQMSQFFTVPAVLAFTVAGVAAYKYEQSLLKIRNLTGTSVEQTKIYGDAMLELGKQVGVTPGKLADAFYFIASSGFAGAEAMDVLKKSAKATAIGFGDVLVTADVVTSAMNAYGHSNLSAAHAVDILMRTVEVGKAEPEALATSLGRIMPVANNLKVSLDEVGGMVAGLTLGGLSASEAVTALRGSMIALVAPAKMSMDELKKLGLSYKGVTKMIEQDGLLAALQMLYEKTEGNKLQMRRIIPNVRALNGVWSLLGASYEHNVEILDKVKNSQGALDRAWERTRTLTITKLKQAWASLAASFIKIGENILPTAAKVAEMLARWAESFANLDADTRKWIMTIVLAVAALGPVVMILGTIINLLGMLRAAWAAMGIVKSLGQLTIAARMSTGAMSAFGSTLAASIGTGGWIALAVVGIGALGYGLYKLAEHFDASAKRAKLMKNAVEDSTPVIRAWADEVLGGHLEKVEGKIVFKPSISVKGDKLALAKFIRGEAAAAMAAKREADRQLKLQEAKAQVAYFDQQLKTYTDALNIGTKYPGRYTIPIEMQESLQGAIQATRNQLQAARGDLSRVNDEFDKATQRDRYIVFKAKVKDVSIGINNVKKQLASIRKQPHTVEMMLKEQKFTEKLAALRRQLRGMKKENYWLTIDVKINTLEDKIKLARHKLDRLRGRGTGHRGTAGVAVESIVSADISKLEKFVKNATNKLNTLNDRKTAPVVKITDAASPVLLAIENKMNELNGMESVVFIKAIKSGPDYQTGGLSYGPKSGHLEMLHGTEAVVPLDPSQRTNAHRVLDMIGARLGNVNKAPTSYPISSSKSVTIINNKSAPVSPHGDPSEVHYHSHMSLPQGVVVSDIQRFGRQVQPFVERGTLLAQRRKDRGRPGL